MSVSLWGDDFLSLSKEDVSKVIAKIKNPKKVKERTTAQKISSNKVSLTEKMEAIKEDVYKILGHYADNTVCIRDIVTLHNYIDAAISNGEIAVDTETNNSLEPITCKLMGPCIYTPGQKNAYIPINHVDRFTMKDPEDLSLLKTAQLIPNQLTEEQIAFEFQRLIDSKTKVIMHNEVFDYKVLYCTTGIRLKAYWDTRVAAKRLDENEESYLKVQNKLHIDPNQDKYDIEHLFQKLPYAIFDPELFALYAATDGYITYMLFKWQENKFKDPDLKDVFNEFWNIEMPTNEVIAKMELKGIGVDIDYAKKLSVYYHSKVASYEDKVNEELDKLKDRIFRWRQTPEANDTSKGKSKNQQLADPVKISSPVQLSILLYDVMRVPVMDKGDPRGTGKEILKDLSEHYPLCKAILDLREFVKLTDTFIDKMPGLILPETGRLHARFDAQGTATGRFSSNSPNLQNIPSHDTLVRMMFKAADGCSIIGGDFSAQEPRMLASMAKDQVLIDTYTQGKDVYAMVAEKLFGTPYEQNLEFHPVTGVKQVDGKARRSNAKTFQLGINYGMSAQGLADRLGISKKEAEAFIDSYYSGFSGIYKFNKASEEMVKKLGYVTTFNGNRRRLPNAQLPLYEVHDAKKNSDFNPLLGAIEVKDNKRAKRAEYYQEALINSKGYRQAKELTAQAEAEGFEVIGNRGLINKALRQCVNARSQGSAAEMTKIAMIKMDNDPLLKELGFELVATIHDEVFGEAPTVNAEAAAQRVCEIMKEASAGMCCIPAKVDPYAIKHWYEDENLAKLQDTYNAWLSKGVGEERAFEITCEKYPIFNQEAVKMVINNTYEIGRDCIINGPNYYTN